MFKRFVDILKSRTGDVLAGDVLSSDGRLLAAEGTVINEYIRSKLIEFGISGLWVAEPEDNNAAMSDKNAFEYIKNNYMSSVLSLRKLLNRLSSGDGLDYNGISDITDYVYAGGKEHSSVIKCIEIMKNTDEYTYIHCINVSFYAMLIAKWLKLPEKSIKEIIQVGVLHDVGKVKVPEVILNKKGKLTDEEFDIIKNHTFFGYDIIKKSRLLDENVKKAVLMHHERMNGTGYPFGVKGHMIDLYSRIVAVADVYDAMTTDRVYKKKSTPFEVFEMFLTVGLEIFDISISKTFLTNLSAYYIGTNVLLSTGETGEVVYIPPHDIVNPVINIQSNYVDLSRESNIKVLCMV